MGTFRKFDPYAFLADPESLAALATLAGRQSAGAIERWEHAPDGEVPPAKPAKASEGLVTLATLAPLARVHSQIEYEDAGPTPAKAAKVANTSPSELRSERTDQFEPASAKAAKLANLSEAGIGADEWRVIQEKRARIIEFNGSVPRSWAEGCARLDPKRPPGDVPAKRWLRFIDDVGRFLNRWAAYAAALGWGPLELFGCDRDRPFARIDQCGFLWLLKGDKLFALTENTAIIETKTGVRQTWRRRPVEPGRVLPWELAS